MPFHLIYDFLTGKIYLLAASLNVGNDPIYISYLVDSQLRN